MASERGRRRVDAAAWVAGLAARDREAAPVRIERVDDIAGGWRFTLEGRALDEPARITVTRVEPGAAYFSRTSELGVRYEGGGATPLVCRLMLQLTRRLGRLSLAALERVLGVEIPADAMGPAPFEPPAAPDPGPRRDGPVPSRGSGPSERPGPSGRTQEAPFPGMHQVWSHPRAWAHFVAEEELMPARDVAFSLGGESVRVEHGDFECQFVDARGFVVKPWSGPRADRGRVRRRRHGPRDSARRPSPGPPGAENAARPCEPGPRGPSERRLDPSERSLFTNLRDLDAIDGGTERFDRLLTAVREHVCPEVLMVNCTCVPQIIGDDAEFVVAEQRPRCRFPIVYKDQSPEPNPHERGLAMMREALEADPPVAREPNVIHLVGFTPGPDRDELRALLGELGIEVHSMIVPEISPALVAGYGRASLQVVFPNPDWLPFCEKLLGGLEVPMLTVPAPYGLRGTTEFLAAVARGLGRGDLLGEIAERSEQFRADPWESLLARAAGERVGLVCELGTAERLGSSHLIWGCPIVPLVREMGFGISLALVAREPASPRAGAVRDRWGREGVEITVVEDEPSLGRWLERDDVAAIYSDFFFDTRLLRAGHVPFSSRIFERGWRGAARSGERLLDRCRLGLVRQGFRHLF